MGRSTEAWQQLEEANEQQRQSEMEEMYAEYVATKDVVVAVTLRTEDDLFNMMVGLNRAYVEQMEADMEPHKRSGYMEQMCEQADMRRKEKRENGE